MCAKRQSFHTSHDSTRAGRARFPQLRAQKTHRLGILAAPTRTAPSGTPSPVASCGRESASRRARASSGKMSWNSPGYSMTSFLNLLALYDSHVPADKKPLGTGCRWERSLLDQQGLWFMRAACPELCQTHCTRENALGRHFWNPCNLLPFRIDRLCMVSVSGTMSDSSSR